MNGKLRRPQTRLSLPIFGLLLACCCWHLSSAVFAQSASTPKPLSIESWSLQPSVVLGRPMVTWWDVKIPGNGLMVGQFKFTIRAEGQLLAVSETEELTLNGPEQRIRVMLPAIDNTHPLDQLEIEIDYHGKSFSGGLGKQILHVPFATKRVYLGLVAESRLVRKTSARRGTLLQSLKFESLIVDPTQRKNEDEGSEQIKTIFASVEPADLPAEALAYCSYDLIVLMGDEFRTLRKPQLEALLAWIKAGGSLYVEPKGVLEPYHVDFLRRLVADDPHEIVIQTDDAGKLVSTSVSIEGDPITVPCGLGAAIVQVGDLEREPERAADWEKWKSVIGPIWKVRSKPAPSLSVTRQFVNGPDGNPVMVETQNSNPWIFTMGLLNRYPLAQSDLLDRLMPENVRMVPLSLLAAVLLVFVVLIGPGDYFVLGKLGLRKLTWITFPLATVAVTAVTVWMSNSYMSTAETRNAAVIRDLGGQGEIVRTNRFELLFISATRRVTNHVEKGIFSALSTHSGFGSGFGVAQRPGSPYLGGISSPVVVPNGFTVGSDGQIAAAPARIFGRLPTEYSATQDLAKWTPQLNRTFSIPGSSEAPVVDWTEFNLSQDERQALQRHELPARMTTLTRSKFGPQAMVACFSGSNDWAYDRAPSWRSSRVVGANTPQQNYNYQRMYAFQGMVDYSGGASGEPDFFRWLLQASVAVGDPGMFAVTKRTCPKGGPSCDDLPVLDPSDPQSWLLVIIVPEKDDYVIYRKLMTFQ